jgi:uncharacterized caspase-like protein
LGQTSIAKSTIIRAHQVAAAAAVVVGINEYSDPEIADLKYAEADATAFAKFLRSSTSVVKDPSAIRVLIGERATTRNIRRAIDEVLIRGTANPDDTAILFFAGHGYSIGDKTYLAGVDSEADSLRSTGISASELSEYWSDIEAERKIMIADACHSGGIRGLRGENEVMDGLSNELSGRGVVSFLASQSGQQSIESDRLQHGVFTWVLLQGLDGRADRDFGDRDGRVSADELAGYLTRTVPPIAQKEGNDQTPVFRGETSGLVFLTTH